MKKYSPHITRNQAKIVTLVAVLVLVVFVAPVHTAHAWWLTDIGKTALHTILSGLENLVTALVELVFYLISKLLGLIMGLASQVLEMSIKFSIDTTNITQITGIYTGWAMFRDLVNLLFIFIILYVAITTILQLNTSQTRRMLASLVIVAVLLNFSFFITGFVIDVGNSTAAIVYNAVTPGTTTIGQTIQRNLQVAQNENAESSATKGMNTTQKAIWYVMSSVFYLAATLVFLAASALFIVRYIVLVFLLMLSPLAFAALILPQTQGQWKRWLHELVNHTFVAPIFLLMIALVIGIANATTVSGTSLLVGKAAQAGTFTLTDAAPQQQLANPMLSSGGLFMNFVIIIALLIAALNISRGLAGSAAGMATMVAGRAVGMGAAGAGMLGRNTLGRFAARRYANNADEWRAVRDNPNASAAARLGARMKLATAKTTANASFDARSGKVGKAIGGTAGSLLGAGGVKLRTGQAGGRGGYQKKLDARIKSQQKELDKTGAITAGDRKRIRGEGQANLEKRRDASAKNVGGILGEAKAKQGSLNKALQAHRAVDTSGMSSVDLARHQQQESMLVKEQQNVAERIQRHEKRATAVMQGRSENVRRGPDSKALEQRAKDLTTARKGEYIEALRKRGRKWTVRPDNKRFKWKASNHEIIANSLKMNRSKADQARERMFEWLDQNKEGTASEAEGRDIFSQLTEEEKTEGANQQET